jgi:hypothetical protein
MAGVEQAPIQAEISETCEESKEAKVENGDNNDVSGNENSST